MIQESYVDGLFNHLDESEIKKGFHPGFIFMNKGEGNRLWQYPLYNWLENAKEGKEKGFKYSFQNEFTTIKYQYIDVTGNIASAKIEFYEGGKLKFIDYLSLIKFDAEWKLVYKMAHAIQN